jgi:hypothetical protein
MTFLKIEASAWGIFGVGHEFVQPLLDVAFNQLYCAIFANP